jgi:hypothetical protein
MKAFHDQVGETLATAADILQPNNFEQLKIYGFYDGPGAAAPVQFESRYLSIGVLVRLQN